MLLKLLETPGSCWLSAVDAVKLDAAIERSQSSHLPTLRLGSARK